MSDSESLSGRTGWAVVAVVAVLLLGIPGLLLFSSPRGFGSYGVYVAIAMVPALAFGALGVWTALRGRGR
jgi:hypothetical protein